MPKPESFPQPKKALSQNFLQDPELLSEILRALEINPQDAVLEVGPGRGFLTDTLVKTAGHTFAIELDRTLASLLEQKHAHQPFTVFCQDVLDFSLAKFVHQHLADHQGPLKLISNLPYHISSPFLFWLYPQRQLFQKIFLTLQQEVALRFSAQIGISKKKDLGTLGLLGELGFQFEKKIFIPKEKFFPQPKVDSIGLVFAPQPNALPDGFFQFAKEVYQSRRKTLQNNPKIAPLLESSKFDPAWRKRRPDELSLEDWQALYRVAGLSSKNSLA